MNALVTINFAGGIASTNLVQVVLDQAVNAIGLNQGISTTVFGFTNLSIWTGHIAFATATGGTFDGTLSLELAWEGQAPAVTLNNLVPSAKGGPATITWPTMSGPETQILTPGDPLTLSGIVSD